MFRRFNLEYFTQVFLRSNTTLNARVTTNKSQAMSTYNRHRVTSTGKESHNYV